MARKKAAPAQAQSQEPQAPTQDQVSPTVADQIINEIAANSTAMVQELDREAQNQLPLIPPIPRSTRYISLRPGEIQLNPDNPRALSYGMSAADILELSRSTAQSMLEPEVFPYLPGLKELAVSLFRTNPAGLSVSPITVRMDPENGYVVVDGDRRLAASRMIAQGFEYRSSTDYEPEWIFNPDWRVDCRLIQDDDRLSGFEADDILGQAVALNGHQAMDAVDIYLFLVGELTRRGFDDMDAKERLAVRRELAAKFARKISWIDHMIAIYECRQSAHYEAFQELLTGRSISIKSARTIAYQPEPVQTRVVNTLSDWAMEHPASTAGLGSVNAMIREARLALGITGAYQVVEGDTGEGEENPETGPTPDQGEEGGEKDGPKKLAKKKAGRKGKQATRSSAPKRKVSELIALCNDGAGTKKVEAKEKRREVVNVLSAIRSWCLSEIDDAKLMKVIRAETKCPEAK